MFLPVMCLYGFTPNQNWLVFKRTYNTHEILSTIKDKDEFIIHSKVDKKHYLCKLIYIMRLETLPETVLEVEKILDLKDVDFSNKLFDNIKTDFINGKYDKCYLYKLGFKILYTGFKVEINEGRDSVKYCKLDILDFLNTYQTPKIIDVLN